MGFPFPMGTHSHGHLQCETSEHDPVTNIVDFGCGHTLRKHRQTHCNYAGLRLEAAAVSCVRRLFHGLRATVRVSTWNTGTSSAGHRRTSWTTREICEQETQQSVSVCERYRPTAADASAASIGSIVITLSQYRMHVVYYCTAIMLCKDCVAYTERLFACICHQNLKIYYIDFLNLMSLTTDTLWCWSILNYVRFAIDY